MIPFRAAGDDLWVENDHIQAWDSVDVETINHVIGSVPRSLNEVAQRADPATIPHPNHASACTRGCEFHSAVAPLPIYF
jgi:hypothetical protein